MRLYDQLKAYGAVTYDPDPELNAAFSDIILPGAKEAVLVDVTNVAEYAHEHMPIVEPNGAPIRVSPWVLSWYEWRDPRASTPTQAAVFIEQVPLESGAHFQSRTMFVGSPGPGRRPVAIGFQLAFVAPNGEPYEDAGPLPITDEERQSIKAAGWKLPQSRDSGIRGTYVPNVLPSGEPRDAVVARMHQWMETGEAVTGLAMTFAHCKNVKMQENHTPPKVAAKRKKAGKPPGASYKTLLIDPMKETLRTEGNIEKNGLKKALHICRGHFATYTEDKPLFGKVTGTFWKPMHVRGNKKHGEIKKDYDIKAPTS